MILAEYSGWFWYVYFSLLECSVSSVWFPLQIGLFFVNLEQTSFSVLLNGSEVIFEMFFWEEKSHLYGPFTPAPGSLSPVLLSTHDSSQTTCLFSTGDKQKRTFFSVYMFLDFSLFQNRLLLLLSIKILLKCVLSQLSPAFQVYLWNESIQNSLIYMLNYDFQVHVLDMF